MKIIATRIALICVFFGSFSSLFAQQEEVFYSIRRGDSHLVTIDTLGNVNDIGYIGFNIGTPSAIPMDFDRCGRLIMLTSSVFYELNLETGNATSISTLTGVAGSGSTMFTFGSNNELYVFKELTGATQGKLYTANLSTGVATAVGGNSGVASILSIDANESGTIFGYEESLQKLVLMDPTTGSVTSQSSGTLGILFPTEIDYNIKTDQLWGFDIVNSSLSSVEVRKVDITTGASVLKFTLNERYVGLATYTASVVSPRPTISTNGSPSLCPGETTILTTSATNSILWSNGETTQSIVVSTAGDYSVVFTDNLGCIMPSPDTVTVINFLADTTSITTTICSGDTLYTYTTSGVYRDTFTNVNGCDSIRTLNLTVLPNSTGFINQTICAGQSYEGYTTSGVHLDTFTASNGCDSLRQITLAVLPAITDSSKVIICDGDTFNGYTTTGVYRDTFTIAGGCDSIFVLDLTVEPLPLAPTISATGNLLSVPSTFDGYQWYQDTTLLNGETSNTYSATTNGNYSVVVTNAAGCESSSAIFNVTGINIDEVVASFSIKIYPNPTYGEVVLKLSNADKAHWELYNSIGQLVLKGNAHSTTTIDLNELVEGVYFIKVIVEDSSLIRKVVKSN